MLLCITTMAANAQTLYESRVSIGAKAGATLSKVLFSPSVEQSDEQVIGSYFHVLNDLERIGDHAENFYEIAAEMSAKKISFSEKARKDIGAMCDKVTQMLIENRISI